MVEARAEHEASEKAKVAGYQHRAKRDALIHALRKSDPDYWSHSVLARAIGCSPELIAHILRKG